MNEEQEINADEVTNDSQASEEETSISDSTKLEVSEFADKKTLGFGFWLATFWLVLISFLAVFSPCVGRGVSVCPRSRL